MRIASLMLPVLVVTACTRTEELSPSERNAEVTSQSTTAAVMRTPPFSSGLRVITQPEDLKTAVGNQLITLSFDQPADSAAAQSLVPQIKLRTYPALEPIAFTTAVRVTDQHGLPVTSNDPALPTKSFVDVTPTSSPAAGWVVLSVSSIPTGQRAGSDIDNPLGGIGAQVARFNRQSSPVMRQVRLTSTNRFEISFSEQMKYDSATIAAALSISTTDSAQCTLVALPPGRAYPTFSFDCPPSAWTSQKVVLNVKPGLEAESGVALGLLHEKGCASSTVSRPLTLPLDFSSAGTCSSGCKELTLVEPDTTPPQLTASVDPSCLWPPNHKMALFTAADGLNLHAVDECDPAPTIRILGVTSDQRPLDNGSGKTSVDFLSGPHAFCVRSERDGNAQSGRHYTARVQAQDASGNVAEANIVVSVPHDQGDVMCPKLAQSRVVSDTDARCLQ